MWRPVNTGMAAVAAALRLSCQVVLVFMTLSVFYEAVMRYLFTAPTTWSFEVNGFLMVYLALLSATDTQRVNEHISIGFMQDKLPPTGRQIVQRLIALAGLVFCAVMVWRGGLMTAQAWQYNERVSSSLSTPMALPYALLPIGFGLLGLQFLLELLAGPAARQSDPQGEPTSVV